MNFWKKDIRGKKCHLVWIPYLKYQTRNKIHCPPKLDKIVVSVTEIKGDFSKDLNKSTDFD